MLPSGLYPRCVTVVVADGTEAPGELTAGEADAIRNAVAKRRHEFAMGRTCARRALSAHGIADAELLVAANRGPVWPARFVGSITHCRGFIGAMVAEDACLASVGFDAEVAEPLSGDLERLVCTPEELAWIRAANAPAPGWPKVLFSAKEAVHKCISPLYGVMLDFLDVSLSPGPDERSLLARASAPGRAAGVNLETITIRIAITERFVFSCAFVAATPGAGVRLN